MESSTPPDKRKHSVLTAQKRIKTNDGSVIKSQYITTPQPIRLELSAPPTEQIPDREEFLHKIAEIQRMKEIRNSLRFQLTLSMNQKLKFSEEMIHNMQTKRCYIPTELLVSDLSARYREQTDIKDRLRSKLVTFQIQQADLKQHFETYRKKLNERKSALRYDMTQLEHNFEQQEHTHKLEFDKLTNLVNFYRKLTGLEVTNLGKEKYRCKVRVHHEELVFNLDIVDDTIDYELHSCSISENNLESILKMDINIDQTDGPSLLFKVISCLMRQ